MIFIKRRIRYLFFGKLVPLLCEINKYVPIYCADYLRYSGIYEGKKCLIVGTAPSLKKDELYTYKHSGYKIIGVNSIIKFLNKDEIEQLLDIYIIQDVQVFERLESELKELSALSIPIFLGSPICYKYSHKAKSLGIPFAINLLDHYKSSFKTPYFTKFSNGRSGFLYDGYTVVYSAVQMAVFFGFKELGILGVDASYSKNIKERNVVDIGKVDPTWRTAGDRINYAFSIAFTACQSEGVTIYNLNKSGNLNTIPRYYEQTESSSSSH